MSNGNERIAGLSPPEKRELLKDLLRRISSQAESKYSLSYGQRALWFLNKLAPKQAGYNCVLALRILSDIDNSTLRGLFQALINRHVCLRTTYTAPDGEPIPCIHDHHNVCFEERDVSDWSAADLSRHLIDETSRPFDLEAGPVVRVNLFTRSSKERILLMTVHHIAGDFWSLQVILRELGSLYLAERTGIQISSAPQYTDYLQWQRSILAGSYGEQLWSYWQKQLSGDLPLLDLPVDRPRPLVQSFEGASYPLKIDKDLARNLRILANTNCATLYMILLAAFQVLLHRYTGQEDILVGSPVACRNQSRFEGIVGYLANPVVLKAKPSGNPTFRMFLDQIRKAVLGALDHQDYPFPLLVERLKPVRDPGRSPVFQVMFQLEKQHRLPQNQVSTFVLDRERSETNSEDIELRYLDLELRINLNGLELQSIDIEQQLGRFDLTLRMFDGGEFLAGCLDYNTDLFDASTIVRMEGHFRQLLKGIVADPEQHISDLPLLTETERHQLLVEWNGPKTGCASNQLVQELFEIQAKRVPDNIAVISKNEQITYRQLNTRANRLAHYLQTLGVKPEVIVGIYMDKSSPEIVEAILGILKAGGAYLPLDPADSKQCLAFMSEDAQVRVIVTKQGLLGGIPFHNARVVCVDADREVILQQSEENPITEVAAHNLAYVTYTSRSTESPMGTMVTHSSLVNAYLALEDTFSLRSLENRHLQMASFSSDVFTGDLVRALCSGGRLVLCPQHFLNAPEKLYELMRQEKVDCAEFVPQDLRNLIQYLDKTGQSLDFMRLIVVGSDNWYVSDYLDLKRLCGTETRVINSYSVTGSAIACLYFEDIEDSLKRLYPYSLVPIGRPFANTQIYLLNQHLQPVPIGVPGELYIGGSGLARGYLNRPELTAERFISNPFSSEQNARLFKTVDMACYLQNGNIEFLGCIARQVKIFGLCIDPSKVEGVLRHHPAVREATVMARKELSGNHLIAYVVPHQGQTTSINELISFLKERIPDYMVPSAFLFLAALPLTPNHIVDYRALPEPDSVRTELRKTPVAPRDTLEFQLIEIWQDILDIRPISVMDNLFDLGGHSLLSVHLLTRIRKRFGQEIPLSEFLQDATIDHLARILRQK